MKKIMLQKKRELVSQTPSLKDPQIVKTSYTSVPVNIPKDFLAPLRDPSVIKTEKIDFEKTTLPEYRKLYAVVLDNVLSQEECKQLIHMAEKSAGGHSDDHEAPNNGWRPAMVNAGPGKEFLALDYRNSDRIIWDEKVIAKRLWDRVLQSQAVKEYLSVLDEDLCPTVLGKSATGREERWVATKQGLNERLRFLKYGAGQYFREHCDGTYETPDGSQRSFYTLHLYLNDSAQALGVPEPSKQEQEAADKADPREVPLRGGATTFHSPDMRRRLDVDPKAGRILIFQHRRLLHSGDDVVSGIKYTLRSDLMYEFDGGNDGVDDVFE